jgi:putative transposase
MRPDYAPFEALGRKHPIHGVHISLGQPTIVFLTVCTKNRQPWLIQSSVHDALRTIWIQADAWLVGYYLLMPDHVHLFCAPRNLSFTLQRWVAFWKREFSCLHLPSTGAWQRDFWDTRLRRSENYTEKWYYVRENPVRAGLVKMPDDWPYQGQLNVLPW